MAFTVIQLNTVLNPDQLASSEPADLYLHCFLKSVKKFKNVHSAFVMSNMVIMLQYFLACNK